MTRGRRALGQLCKVLCKGPSKKWTPIIVAIIALVGSVTVALLNRSGQDGAVGGKPPIEIGIAPIKSRVGPDLVSPPPPLPDRRYFPYEDKTVRANSQALGDGAIFTEPGGTGLLISRTPGSELFYGLTLTVQPGGDDSWKPYLDGELDVEFSPSREDQKLVLKAELVLASESRSWIYGEVRLDRRPGEPLWLAGRVVRRIAVRDLLQNEPEPHGYRVNRLTIEERLEREPGRTLSFTLHRVVLRAKPAR